LARQQLGSPGQERKAMIAIDVAAGAHKTPSFSQMNNIGEQQLVDSLRKRPGIEIEQSRR